MYTTVYYSIGGLPKGQTCLFNKLGNKLRPDIEYQNKPNG